MPLGIKAGFGSKPNYSGFDVDSWNEHNSATQILKTHAAKDTRTLIAQTKIEQLYGARYLVLSRLG